MGHFIAPAIAALALATAASAQTTVLPFDGVGVFGLRSGYADRVDGPVTGGYTYGGSGTYTPNVLMSFGGVANGSWVSALNWPTGYNDLINVIFAGVNWAAGPGTELRVTFVADPGYVTSVHAFDIGNFGVALTLPYVRVVDESGAVLFEELNVPLEASTSPNERNFVLAQPPEGRILTLRIGLGGLDALAVNVGLDNVEYRQRATTTNEIGTTYCDPGVPNASGGPGHLRAWGQRSGAANDVTLVATGLPLGSFGYFLASRSSDLVMGPGNSVGNLCLGGAIGRYVAPGQIRSSQESGNIFLALDLSAMPTPTGPVQAGAGETWYFQAWHRDSLSTGAAVSNFTEALELTFQLNLPDEDGEGFDHPAGSTPTELVTEDANVSGAPWGPDYLGLGLTGGSGRHGSIHVGAGETVLLDTDVQTFPIGPLVQIDVIGNGSGANYPNFLTVTDGVFELSSLIIEPTGRLVLQGSHPARLLVRGRCSIAPGGLLDVSGETASPHDATTPKNIGVATPPAGGPQGAAGGLGGDRADLGGTNLISVGAIANPGAIRTGQNGGGVGGTPIGSGLGGVEYPLVLPTGVVVFVATTNDVGYNIGPDPLDTGVASRCIVQQLGASGSGGAYALPGGDGSAVPIDLPQTENPLGFPISPGATNGGDASSLMLEAPDLTGNNNNYDQRILRWQDDNLRGGSSGGGGGNHPFATHNNAGGVPNPVNPVSCVSVGFHFPNIELWVDHSGASGGAGGGALEILAGREIDLDGAIDASGGGGGDALSTIGLLGSFAMPGGGGSGGAVRLRGSFVSVGPGARVDVGGGIGGNAPWARNMTGNQTHGGAGSPGLFRVEDANADPMTQISFDTIRAITLPINPNNPLDSFDWLSVAPNYLDAGTVMGARPDTLSGVASCWIKPQGNFLQINFREDSGPAVSEQGWTMDVVLDDGAGGTTLRPFRGVDMANPVEWEAEYGNLIGYDLMNQSDASPIIVRFQGGQARETFLTDPCNTNVNDADQILPGTLTPWVSHPADIALVVDATGAPFTPNMVRYCIIFDATNDGFFDTPGMILQQEMVLGVDNLLIIADPK